MRPFPTFPEYQVAKPPAIKKWIGVGAFLIFLSGSITALLKKTGGGIGFVFICMFAISVLIGICYLFRFLYFRLSVHHSNTWKQEVEQEHKTWWDIHQRKFALQEVILVGPAGVDASDWFRVVKREQKYPPTKEESCGKVLRIARTFSSDVAEREKQLAKILVLQWKNQKKSEQFIFPQRFFWLGNMDTWQVFSTQLKDCFPGINPPEFPELWNGEETLSLLANSLDNASSDTCYLVAGCQSLLPSFDDERPAGESAVLWLVGNEGFVELSRGEVFDLSEPESLQDVTLRAQKQSNLEETPEACVLFSHPDQQELANCGWSVNGNIQDDYWGRPGNLDALIVISLAAFFVKYEKKPCGWIASDPLHTLAIGIVKLYEN